MYMTESQFIGNFEKKGGGISLKYLWGINGVSKMNSVILSWLLISENHAEEGMYLEQYNIIHERSTIHLAHSKIMFNCAQKGGGGIFLLSTVLSATSHDITTFDIEDIESDTRMSVYFTDIVGNKGNVGSALKLQNALNHSLICDPESGVVWLKSVSISANSINEATLHYAAAAVHVYFIHRLVLEDTDFYNNGGVGVYASNSDIILVGNVSFE